MDLVMFHSGKEFPEFLEHTFSQVRLFNPDIDIYFLTDKEYIEYPIFEKYKVIPVNKDLFKTEKINEFKKYYGHTEDGFWTITATRLIYIERFLEKYKLEDVYLFENDVLLYYDLQEHHSNFQELYKHLAITIGGADKCMTGFMFIKNGATLARMTEFFIYLLKRKGIIKLYGMDMINEMTLMRAYSKTKKELQGLPILPFGEFSDNYEVFNSIFDPASWGQFVGGNIQEKKPGLKPTDHYIGQLLLQYPKYTVIWKKDDKDRNIPYFKYDNQEVKINNLHIHSKNLHKYIS
jgi:hypothetical protein